MAAAIALRSHFIRTERKAGRSVLALATTYDGGSRSEAVRVGDVVLQIIRDWVLRFNAEGPSLADARWPATAPSPNYVVSRVTAAGVIEALILQIDAGLIPPTSRALSRIPFPAIINSLAFLILAGERDGLPSLIDKLRAADNPRRICSRRECL